METLELKHCKYGYKDKNNNFYHVYELSKFYDKYKLVYLNENQSFSDIQSFNKSTDSTFVNNNK